MHEIITERPNLFEPNDYITVSVKIIGTICPDKLTVAIKEAYKANETTMSKIMLHKNKAYYEKIYLSGCKIEITEKNLLEIIKINEKIPFALDKGELIRTFIIPNKNNTEIIIMAHHLAGDGKSIIYFIKDIMNALSGAPLIYKSLTPLTKQELQQTSLTIPAKLYIHYCKRKWKDYSFTWQDYYHLHNKYWETTHSDIKYITLSIKETQQILEEAKHIGCSVNSYIITKFLERYQHKCRVGIPISIRKPGNESLSNLTSGIILKYKFHAKKSFAKNAIQIDKKIKKLLQKNTMFVLKLLLELPATLIDAVLLNTYQQYSHHLAKETAKIMGYSKNTKSDLGISNLTMIDIPSVYGNYRIANIIFVPPAISYSHHVFGISTMDGQMTISYHNMV